MSRSLDTNVVFSLGPTETATAQLLLSGMFADAEIRLGSKVFKVHKNIVCLKSTYFMLCFMGRFQESQNGIVNLDEGDWQEEEINFLLQFLYTGSASSLRNSTDEKNAWLSLMRSFVVADYFQVDSLCRLLEKSLEEQAHLSAQSLLRLPLVVKPPQVQQIHTALQVLYDDYACHAHVQDTFAPVLLRVILCRPDKFPLRPLHQKHPRLLEGRQNLIALSSERKTIPCDLRTGAPEFKCPRCSRMRTPYSGTAPLTDSCCLDPIEWVVHQHEKRFVCTTCFKLPSHAAWQAGVALFCARKNIWSLEAQLRNALA